MHYPYSHGIDELRGVNAGDILLLPEDGKYRVYVVSWTQSSSVNLRKGILVNQHVVDDLTAEKTKLLRELTPAINITNINLKDITEEYLHIPQVPRLEAVELPKELPTRLFTITTGKITEVEIKNNDGHYISTSAGVLPVRGYGGVWFTDTNAADTMLRWLESVREDVT